MCLNQDGVPSVYEKDIAQPPELLEFRLDENYMTR
jgi:hypothetical protein